MSALVQAQAQAILNAVFRNVAYTLPAGTGRKARLMTANGTQAAAGTELAAGSGYAAGGVAVVFDAATAETGTYSGKVNNQLVTYTNMPDTTATPIVGVEVTDNAATPNRLAFGALSASKTTGLGDTLSFPAAQLTVSI